MTVVVGKWFSRAMLAVVDQIIRACDLATTGETHLVLSVLEPSWQHLQALAARFIADAAVMERWVSLETWRWHIFL